MIRQLNDDEVRALHYELLLKDIHRAAEKLPPFPDVVWKVMALIRRTAPVSEIEAVIKYDQVIVSRLLTLSQSAYYGRRYDVGSLQDAILILGGQKLVQALMTICSARYFQSGKAADRNTDTELWEHSVATGIMSETLARRLKCSKVLTTYTAGLLHDLGKTVLDLYARMYLGKSLKQIRQAGTELIAAERRALGIDHQELGESIARRWRFPEEVIMAIAHHHWPQGAPTNRDVAAIVYVANRLVTVMDDEDQKKSFDPAKDVVFAKLGITASLMGDLQANLVETMSGVKQFLSR